MLTALKESLIDMVIFKYDWEEDHYPEWYESFFIHHEIEGKIEDDGFDNVIIDSGKDIFTLSDNQTVILRNRQGSLIILDRAMFEKTYVQIDEFKAALREECVRVNVVRGMFEIENYAGSLRKLSDSVFLKHFQFPHYWKGLINHDGSYQRKGY